MPDASGDHGCYELHISLDRIVIWFLSITILFALAGMLVYIYFLQNGQFDDIEDVKYQMFRDEE